MQQKILFVCTGNTCRSPMAEGLLTHMASVNGIELEVKSAGLAAAEGIPMADHAKQVLQDKQIQYDVYSKPLTEELLDWADLVLTMTHSHKSQILVFYPEKANQVYTLKEFANAAVGYPAENDLGDTDITDPFGGSLDEYRKCAEEIEANLARLIDKLK